MSILSQEPAVAGSPTRFQDSHFSRTPFEIAKDPASGSTCGLSWAGLVHIARGGPPHHRRARSLFCGERFTDHLCPRYSEMRVVVRCLMRKVMAVMLLAALFCLGLFEDQWAFGDMPGLCTPVPCGCQTQQVGCCMGNGERGSCMNGNGTCTSYQNFDCSGFVWTGRCDQASKCFGTSTNNSCPSTVFACSGNK